MASTCLLHIALLFPGNLAPASAAGTGFVVVFPQGYVQGLLGCPLLALRTIAKCLQCSLSLLFCSICQPSGNSQCALHEQCVFEGEGESPSPSGASLDQSALVPPPPPPLLVVRLGGDSTSGDSIPPLLYPSESGSGHLRIPDPCLHSPAASILARFANHRSPPAR